MDFFIKNAWQKAFRDIQIKGFDFNKILSEIIIETDTDNSTDLGAGVYDLSFVLSKACKTASFFISSIMLNVKTDGNVKIELIEGSTTTVLFDELTNGDIYININEYVKKDFTIKVTNTSAILYNSLSVYDTCDCTGLYYGVSDTQTYGIDLEAQIRCDKSKHLCKYVDLIAPAVIANILGQFWFKVHTTNRANEHKIFKDVDAIAMMGHYDNTYMNMVVSDGKQLKVDGLYQIELKNINIPLPKCKCCLECKEQISSVISIN